MTEDMTLSLREALRSCPPGKAELRSASDRQAFDCPLPLAASSPEGRALIDGFALFPGIGLTVERLLGSRLRLCYPEGTAALTLRYCRTGSAGLTCAGRSLLLGAGELCLFPADSDASELFAPTGCYEGVTITISPDMPEINRPAFLSEEELDPSALLYRFGHCKSPILFPQTSLPARLTASLWGIPQKIRLACYRLMVWEILLALSLPGTASEQPALCGAPRQTALIREVRDFLTENLDRRFTIGELSKKYLINPSSLKALFKEAYGMPIATYVRDRRIALAMTLLREGGDSIAAVAEKVGYETQRKFTQAFKKKTGLLPSEYRRLQAPRR